MKPLFVAAASLACLFVVTAPLLAAESHPLRRGEIAPDPQTMASITQGPDMNTRANSNHPALAGTVTAKRWHELRDRDR
jgi:hypothetical protein